jgi:hypothetical protein
MKHHRRAGTTDEIAVLIASNYYYTLIADTGYVRAYNRDVKDITLSLDKETLDAGRDYAQRHQTTLNALLRELLMKTVLADRKAAVREMFRLMDQYPDNSEGHH